MGNLVRKKAQLLVNATIATSLLYAGDTNPLVITDYNQINPGDKILKFSKSKTGAGTAQIDTFTAAIAYPNSAQDGAELHVTISGRENLGMANGAGRADQFYLSGVTFQGYLASLAAHNVGMLADADLQKLIDQIVIAINTHPFFGSRITASRTNQNLVLTSKSALFQFETIAAQQYGTLVLTTPGVYPKLTLADVQRLFPMTTYKSGMDASMIPNPTITDWARYYFKIEKDPAYSLDGANHTDKYIEEVEIYIPTAEAEKNGATKGTWWDEKIFDFLTDNSYADPHAGTTPWGLVEGVI